MKNILVIGAGRSSSSLIKYLLDNSAKLDWKVTVGDMSLNLAKEKVGKNKGGRAIAFDVKNEEQRKAEIGQADIVISMLPANMHLSVAKDCLEFKKHLITASYVSKEMQELDQHVKSAGLLFMNEIGLDPGIDHMSAMKIIDEIKNKGGEVLSFKSYCGGLVAPESNDNPWGYKFSWNPRNVILAGQGTAKFIENGKYKYLPYNRLFKQIEKIAVKDHGEFEAYANRDSLSYRVPYKMENIPTMLRGTLRMPGYCKAWNAFVKLGLTDDTYKVEKSESLTYKQLIEAFLPEGEGSVKERLAKFLNKKERSKVMQKIEWTGILDDKVIGLKNASPAQILQQLLEEKWKLKENDKDMIVMQHQFIYKLKNKQEKLFSSLVVKGDDQVYTAMAKTVGLPMAIMAKLILTEQVKLTGVQIPTMPEVYNPVLKELEELGIKFEEY